MKAEKTSAAPENTVLGQKQTTVITIANNKQSVEPQNPAASKQEFKVPVAWENTSSTIDRDELLHEEIGFDDEEGFIRRGTIDENGELHDN